MSAYCQAYFGEGFSQHEFESPFMQGNSPMANVGYDKKKMSLESNEEMLQFVDDPSLFEFNQIDDCADLDNYEAMPVPFGW
jgi:hypothetical protein